MRIERSLKSLSGIPGGSVVTIGVFDGVHVGHGSIIRKAVSRAKSIHAKSVVLTFDPHPVKVLRPGLYMPTLISLEHRIRLIARFKPDTVIVMPFNKKLAGRKPENFIRDILVRKLSAREILVGKDFCLGKNAAAGVKDLQRIAARYGITVRAHDTVKKNGRAVSSSAIRKAIAKGDIKKASYLLGRPASVLGTVVKGARLARSLGYPTANLNPHHEAIPPSGVYAVRVRIGRRLYGGVLNIGLRPTFYGPRDMEPSIEVHIFGFRGSIYGREVEVFFEMRIRSEKKFDSPEDLVARIGLDEATARRILDK